jgi:putative cardiolipin synthase
LFLDEPPSDNPAAEQDSPIQVGSELVRVIDAAQSEVWLVSAYLIPTDDFEAAIQRAIERGVRVRMLTNSLSSNNHLAADSAYRRHTRSLVEMGAELHELRVNAADRFIYIESPVEDKSLCLHAKLMIVDNNLAFVGSANFDPRSLRLNTEMGLLVDSVELNEELRQLVDVDFDPRNSWQVKLDQNGEMIWVSGDEVQHHQPDTSFMHRIEDWFFSLLPIEDEM